jgi:hypothetical protein
MDYAEMNLGSWSSYLPRFKDLLRPEGAAPLGEPGEGVEAARGQEAAQSALAAVSGALPDLVFEGYPDWYSYDDEWVLRNLGQVLTEGEEDEILRRLDTGTPDSLAELLSYVEDQLGSWQNAARQEFAGDSEAELLTGAENTANWQASRTPGTFYYTYSGDRYLYCDLPQAPASEWETLPAREQLASDNAQPWGDSGWFCTPTGEPGLYDGAFVFAPSPDGPWMTVEQATAQLQAEPAARPAMPQDYDPAQAAAEEPGDDGEYGDELSEDEISTAMAELLEQNPAFAEIPEDRRRALLLEAVGEMAG